MRSFVVRPCSLLKGKISFPGDKSIAHRCVIISALSRGKTSIKNFPDNKDCLSTVRAFRKLGIRVKQGPGSSAITVFGKGLCGLKSPSGPIYVGESGTTLRLLLGVLAGQNFQTKLVAGASLSNRPMLRVNTPLRMMGAVIKAKGKRKKEKGEEYPPIIIRGGSLNSIQYRMPVASAQVKSAILLAGLFAKGKTSVKEAVPTRDHTERMLQLFKADIKVKRNTIVMKGDKDLVSPGTVIIPGDISSAAFFMVSAAILPDSWVLIRNVSLNPSRTGVLKVLKRMGAYIKVKRQKETCLPAGRKGKSREPSGDLLIKSNSLRGVTVKREEIPLLIDEIPILMVAACYARGKTVFEGAGELRVKETDRIRSMSENLKKMGAKISVSRADNTEKIIIEGVKQLKGRKVASFGDHRTAMSMVVAGLAAIGETVIDDITCIEKSFPNFLGILKTLRH